MKKKNTEKLIEQVTRRILSGGNIKFDEALKFSHLKGGDLQLLLLNANRIRAHFCGNKIDLCSITNAKSGACPEDCSFCSQSLHHRANVLIYPLITVGEILRRAKQAFSFKAKRFCIVISGRKVSEKDLNTVCKAISAIKKRYPRLSCDASLGTINDREARLLKTSGLDRYNHNIETAPSYYKKICSTHDFHDRLKTIEVLKRAGLEICCGGIIGLGENRRQRLELAFKLKELNVDCVPINFLHPIAGTPLERKKIPAPLELLKWIAIFRFILVNKQIRICGGRQKNLRDLQSMIFFAGANSILTGNYLTTKGNLPSDDIKMIEDVGLKV